MNFKILKKRRFSKVSKQGDKYMSKICEICGKKPLAGINVSHAHNKTKRRFLPNLRTVRITLEDGTTRKLEIVQKNLELLKRIRNY